MDASGLYPTTCDGGTVDHSGSDTFSLVDSIFYGFTLDDLTSLLTWGSVAKGAKAKLDRVAEFGREHSKTSPVPYWLVPILTELSS